MVIAIDPCDILWILQCYAVRTGHVCVKCRMVVGEVLISRQIVLLQIGLLINFIIVFVEVLMNRQIVLLQIGSLIKCIIVFVAIFV